MAFPTTPVLDAFTRANGSLGANWTDVVESGDASPSITSNAVGAASGAFASSCWNAATFKECEAYLTIPSTATALTDCNIYLRVTNQNSSSACGFIIVNQTSGLTVYRWINNTGYTNLANLGTNFTAGQKIGATAQTVGNNYVVTVYKDVGAGWVLHGSVTDTNGVTNFPALNVAGRIGFQVLGSGSTTKQIDDFGGGTIVTTTPGSAIFTRRQRTASRFLTIR